LGHNFYNSSIKRYTAIFGTLFNDIIIERRTDNGTIEKRFKVPLDLAPYQKFLTKLKQDPDLNKPAAIQLPRMSYEITSIDYDSDNKLGNHGQRVSENRSNKNVLKTKYTPVPYNIQFSLYIMTKYTEDGNQIVEQILPFFRPDWTSSVEILPNEPGYYIDVPVTLNSVTMDDAYEGSYEERRVILWTLTFTMQCQFFGPVYERKVIKFIETNFYTDTDMRGEEPQERFTIQPGLDEDGNPTRDINETIPYQEINESDNWDYIVQFYDEKDLKK
jgi:hypothetical protein